MRIYFARHGETDWNVQKRIQGGTDIELNEIGIQQARNLGEKIAMEHLGIEKIYSSKLKRAYKTASVIGDRIDTEVVVMDGLEEIHLGLWEGMRWSEVEEKYPEEYRKWYENRRYHKPPQGESYQELMERVMSAIHLILKKEHQSVLVVTHSADIVTLLAMIHDVSFQNMFQKFKIGNADLIEMDHNDLLKIQL